MKSETFLIELIKIGFLVIVIFSSTLVLGLFLLNDPLSIPSSPSTHITSLSQSNQTNDNLTIDSIGVRDINQSEYSNNLYFYAFNITPHPAKVIYGLLYDLTIFLNTTYSGGGGFGLGICSFKANFVKPTNWEFVPYMSSCPMKDYYGGKANFLIFREIIPINYNTSISYPIRITFTVSSYADFPVSITSQPFTLEINN